MRLRTSRTLLTTSLVMAVGGTALSTYLTATATPEDMPETVQAVCTDPAWDATAVYVADDHVSHGGHTWRAMVDT